MGCGEANLLGYYDQQCSDEYYSHEEFQNFIEKYNSRNDGFVGSFISFDFDSSDIVEYKCYEWSMVARLNKYMDDMLFDKYQEDKLGLSFILYVNDMEESGVSIKNAYQIVCVGITGHQRYIINSKDAITLTRVEGDDAIDIQKYYNSYKSTFYNPFALNYNYITEYSLCVNGNYYMEIVIAGLEDNVSQEQLDEICQLLMDNIVIINTER